ncbi:MAG: hypothetical protein QF890_17590 [Myxococcota bacterium]|nr:hypothetical protein [Myxococcota bacterium]
MKWRIRIAVVLGYSANQVAGICRCVHESCYRILVGPQRSVCGDLQVKAGREHHDGSCDDP